MNQFHLYPHQVYRRNTRNNLYTDESGPASPELNRSRYQTNPKEITINDYVDQNSKKSRTEVSPRKKESKQMFINHNAESSSIIGQRNKSPAMKSQQSKRSATGVLPGSSNNNNNNNNGDSKKNNKPEIIPQDKSIRGSSRNASSRNQIYDEDDGDVFDKKPTKSATSAIIIGGDSSRGFVDAQQIMDKAQKEQTTNRNNKSGQKTQQEIGIINDSSDQTLNLEYRPSSRSQHQNIQPRSGSGSNSRNGNRRRGDSFQDKENINISQSQIKQPQRNSNEINIQVQGPQETEEEQKQNRNRIDINFQDIAFEGSGKNLNRNSDQKSQDKQSRQKAREDIENGQNKKEGIENGQNKNDSNKNNTHLLQKYKLEQDYLKGLKPQNNTSYNQSVLSTNKNDGKSQNDYNDGNESDKSEDTRLAGEIKNYRRHYRKNIDSIYKQIKTEYNSPSDRSIYFHEEAINNGLRNSAKNKVRTEPNEDSAFHNLTISKPSLNFNTTLPKVGEENYPDQDNHAQYSGAATVPIHVILGKIRSRSSYTQKLERLSQNIHGSSPNRSQLGGEELSVSQVNNEQMKVQRSNLTSKKYLNMYSRTIDSMPLKDQNQTHHKKQGDTLNNSFSSSTNGLVIRNAQKQKGGIHGLNKTLDVQKLNEEIDMLESQSKAYQKSLNTSFDADNQPIHSQKSSHNLDETFKNTLNKQDNQENPRDIAKQLVKIGLVYYSQNQYQVASQKLLKAQQILKKERLQRDILYHWILEHLGNIYKSWGETEQAFVFYKECYTIRKKIDNPNLKQLAQSALNVAQLLIQNENYQNAISYLQELLSITAVKLDQIISTFDLKNNRDILELIMQSVEIIENDHLKKDILTFYQKIKPLVVDSFGPTNDASLRVKERIEELSAFF